MTTLVCCIETQTGTRESIDGDESLSGRANLSCTVEREHTVYVYLACEGTDSSMLSLMTAESYLTLSSSLSPDKGPGGRVCQLTMLAVPSCHCLIWQYMTTIG